MFNELDLWLTVLICFITYLIEFFVDFMITVEKVTWPLFCIITVSWYSGIYTHLFNKLKNIKWTLDIGTWTVCSLGYTVVSFKNGWARIITGKILWLINWIETGFGIIDPATYYLEIDLLGIKTLKLY